MWSSLSEKEVVRRIEAARRENMDIRGLLGYPATTLDVSISDEVEEVIQNLARDNPNHIGCHTSGTSEVAWAGTQALEREAIGWCAELMGGDPEQTDGYVSTGGTEGNFQALWRLRNYWREEDHVRLDEMAILCSEDTHHSVMDTADILGMQLEVVPVDGPLRQMTGVRYATRQLQARGIKRVAVVLNMGTTIFGSVDDHAPVFNALDRAHIKYYAHVDAAFGGFVYPFTRPFNRGLTFYNPHIVSIALDPHKMLGAPLGTGVLLTRKWLPDHTIGDGATYIRGGRQAASRRSRSGVNAVTLWAILARWGHEGRGEFVIQLEGRARRLEAELREREIEAIRTPGMNIVTVPAHSIPPFVADKYAFVPDNYGRPNWRKIIVMPHVDDALINRLLADLDDAQAR